MCVCILYVSLNTCLLVTVGIYIRAYCNVAATLFLWLVTVTSPYRYKQFNTIYMEAKRILQRAVKNMINGNTALLHIGNFDTGKRTNLKRAVSECVYASRLYYNIYSQPGRIFKVELYETHIAAFNEYTEYHINFDATSKYYTLVISGMQFLIVSDLGWCNIWQVFNTDTPVTTDCKQETETNCEQVYDVVFNDDTASNCKHMNIACNGLKQTGTTIQPILPTTRAAPCQL